MQRSHPGKRISVGDDEQDDLAALRRMLWTHKVLIALVCGICAVVAVALALTATPLYRAEVVVTAVHSGSTGSAASTLASQLGGLAGLNLTQANAEVQTAEAVLESHRLVEEFIVRNRLLAQLGRNPQNPPTLRSAVKMFEDSVLTIHNDTLKGVTIVAIEWSDPVTAARWANGFVALANELLRTRALGDSKRNIAYLEGQLAQTNAIELRQVMYDIIEGETKTLMLANGRAEYAFQVVDPAFAPEVRIGPKRTFTVLVGSVLGLLIGTTLAFVHDRLGWRKRALGRAHDQDAKAECSVAGR